MHNERESERISFAVSEKTLASLERIADLEGSSLAAVCKAAIGRALADAPAEIAAAFDVQISEAVWREFRGLDLDDEVAVSRRIIRVLAKRPVATSFLRRRKSRTGWPPHRTPNPDGLLRSALHTWLKQEDLTTGELKVRLRKALRRGFEFKVKRVQRVPALREHCRKLRRLGRCTFAEMEACGPDADLLEELIDRRHPRKGDIEFPSPKSEFEEWLESLNASISSGEFFFSRGGGESPRLDLDELLKRRGPAK